MSDLVCISHLRWDFVWQRPQHLLSRLSKFYRVLFVEEPTVDPEATHPYLNIKTQTDRLTVLEMVYPGTVPRWVGHGDKETQSAYTLLLRDYLKKNKYDTSILWLYTPMAHDFVPHIPHKLFVYDVMDQLSAFKGAPPEIMDYERKLLPKADIVFTGGVSLYRDKAPLNPNTHCFPSGVDIDHYSKAASQMPTPDGLKGMSSPIIGYFGVIDERMDMPLLEQVANAHPEWNIVLVGPIAKIRHEDLSQQPNIHFLGKQSYENLPQFLSHFDVALVPFALNESTEYVSPTKTLEYMAAHKPIVSTPIRDVIDLYGEVVKVGHTPEEFIKHIETSLTENGKHRRAAEKRLLTQNLWESIAAEMYGLMQKQLTSAKAG